MNHICLWFLMNLQLKWIITKSESSGNIRLFFANRNSFIEENKRKIIRKGHYKIVLLLFSWIISFPDVSWFSCVLLARRTAWGEEGKLCVLLDNILHLTAKPSSNAFFPFRLSFFWPIRAIMFIFITFTSLFLASLTDPVSDFFPLLCFLLFL